MPNSQTGHEGFDFWKDEFTSTVQEIEQALHEQKDITELIQQAASTLPNLLLEVRGVSNNQHALKQELMDIYKACKMQLETYQTLNEQKELFFHSNNQSSETTSTTTTNNSSNSSQRQQVQAKTQGRVINQNTKLQDALKSIKESEEIALEITNELSNQRTTIQNTQSKTNEFSDMTKHAKGLLKSMNKKWWQKW